MVKQAVIIAGGKGTRMKPFTDRHPKPMYPIQGKPFIEYLILQIREFGIHDILILLGYMAAEIKNFLGDGSAFGVHISYDITPIEYGTLERLLHAAPLIDSAFLFLYCDNYCPVDYVQLLSDFARNQAMIQLSVYENRDEYTKNNLLLEGSKVRIYDKSREAPGLNGVDIGYAVMDKQVITLVESRGGRDSASFEATVYPELARQGKLYATVTRHRYYSVGSWERISLTNAFFSNPVTVFLDRDGTVNQKAPKACYIERPDQFVWLEGAKDAVRMLKEAGCRVILVTNQPGIARGRLTEAMLAQIHELMQEELERDTGYRLDAIYYCPHDWSEGCECRKPRPGMLYAAQKDFSLDLTKAVLIGDDERDMEAGKSAGCTCIRVTEGYNLLRAVMELLDRGSFKY